MSVTVKSVKQAQAAGHGLKLGKKIKRLTVLVRDPAGQVHAETYTKKRAEKKKTKSLKPSERLTRETAKAARTMIDNYLDRHDRSNRKRRDGWLRDYNDNMSRANRKGAKKVKLAKIIGL
jgi:hypothetical protein